VEVNYFAGMASSTLKAVLTTFGFWLVILIAAAVVLPMFLLLPKAQF
jgi:hypothetical protein